MMKGKIVEINNNSITLMTNDMKFVRVKSKEHAEIGKEIFYFEEDLLVSRTSSNMLKLISAAVVMIAMFIGISSYNVPTQPLISTVSFESEIVAVVSLDINPSVEFELDKNLKVVNAIATNNDGNVILDLQLIKGKYVTLAIKDMLKLAKDALFINDISNTVLITTAPTDSIDETSSKELEKQMKNLAMESSDEEIEYVVASAPTSTLVEAREKEVSLGKLNVYDNLESKGQDVSLVEIENKKVVEIKDDGYLEDESYEKIVPAKKIEKSQECSYIIKDGVEFANAAAFEKLAIVVELDLTSKEVFAKYGENQEHTMKHEYAVLIKDDQYYFNIKEILDVFEIDFNYEGSKFVLDKSGKNLQLNYVGEGIKAFATLADIEDSAVAIDDKKVVDIVEDQKLGNIANDEKKDLEKIEKSVIEEKKVETTEETKEVKIAIVDANKDEKKEQVEIPKEEVIETPKEEFKRDTIYNKDSKYDMIVSSGTEWISEDFFIRHGFSFEYLDKIYVKYETNLYEIDPSIIGLIDGVRYFETKSMLEKLALEYGYTQDGFYIKTEKSFNQITNVFEGEIKFETYK